MNCTQEMSQLALYSPGFALELCPCHQRWGVDSKLCFLAVPLPRELSGLALRQMHPRAAQGLGKGWSLLETIPGEQQGWNSHNFSKKT